MGRVRCPHFVTTGNYHHDGSTYLCLYKQAYALPEHGPLYISRPRTPRRRLGFWTHRLVHQIVNHSHCFTHMMCIYCKHVHLNYHTAVYPYTHHPLHSLLSITLARMFPIGHCYHVLSSYFSRYKYQITRAFLPYL